MKRARRRSQSGFALLFVFAMAAIVAIMLYLELPRVAFEAQRAKEQLLIDRGEQYKRAIKLYVRRFNRYPATIEQLENTNNIRFLRRRYKDPMTGKSDWRLIHSAGGVLTDSLTQKAPGVKGAVAIGQMSGDNQAADAGTQQQQPLPVASWRRLRGGQRPNPGQLIPQPDSETGSEDTSGGDQSAGEIPPAGPETYGEQQPGEQQPSPEQQPYPGEQQPPQVQQGEATPGPVLPPVQLFPGQPLPRGQQQQQTQPFSVTGSLGAPSAGSPGAAADNPALDAIRRQLTGGSSSSFPGNFNVGAGIAGVASKSGGEGIKVYNDHTKYKEWEFIYDPRKDVPITGQAVSAFPNMPAQPANPTKPQY
jgi:type II secretory pathway pseudopilin PulG